MEQTYLITYIPESVGTFSFVKYYTITCKIENIRNIFNSVVKEKGKFNRIESLEFLKSPTDSMDMSAIDKIALREGLTRYIYFDRRESKWVIRYSPDPDYYVLNLTYNTKAKILYMKQSDINKKEYYRNLIMDKYHIKENNLSDAIYNIKNSDNTINIRPLKDLEKSGEKIFLILDSLLPLNNFMSVFKDMYDIKGLVLLMTENDSLYEIQYNYYNYNEIKIKKV